MSSSRDTSSTTQSLYTATSHKKGGKPRAQEKNSSLTNDVDEITLGVAANQKVVRLDVPVDEVPRMHELQTADLTKRESRLGKYHNIMGCKKRTQEERSRPTI